MNLFKGLLSRLCPWRARDELALQMPFLRIELSRHTGLEIPHEVHIIVPRAEFRGRRCRRDGSEWEFEVILSSISVVHAPRHPLAGESPGVQEGGNGTAPVQRVKSSAGREGVTVAGPPGR